MTATDQTEMLSVDQAADELGISPRRVRQLAGEETISGNRDAEGRWSFTKAEVERVKAHRKASGNEGKPKSSVIDLRDLHSAVAAAASATLGAALTEFEARQETHIEQLSQSLARAATAETRLADVERQRDEIKAASIKNANDWKAHYDQDTAALRKRAEAAEARAADAETSRDDWKAGYEEVLSLSPREFRRFQRDYQQQPRRDDAVDD